MKTRIVAQFDQVSKVYRRGLVPRRAIQALRSVSLKVPAGSTFGLLGPNRAGKTTLAKILLSVCRPTSGRVTRLGAPICDRFTLKRVGYVHESQAFPSYLTARGLLDYYGSLSCVSRAELRQRVPRLLEQVGLCDRSQEPIGGFSKGMLQRLALAQALVNDPELLVLDEPTEGMDLLARHLLHDLIRQHKASGKTVILVSHSLADVEQLCDRAAVLRAGEVAFDGTLDELTHTTLEESDGSLEDALEPLYAGATR